MVILSRVVLSLVSFALMAFGQSEGTIVKIKRVVDGDTVVTSDDKLIRLHCIDAPELAQTFGVSARDELLIAIGEKEVMIFETGRDGNSSSFAEVVYDGRNVNVEMVSKGKAFVDPKNCVDLKYKAAEDYAKSLRRGMWITYSEDNPIQMPWEYRNGALAVTITVPVIEHPSSDTSSADGTQKAPDKSRSGTRAATASAPNSSGGYSGSRAIHTGPRGGRYYISPSGKKVYVKKK